MGLMNLMMRYLSELWNRSENSTQLEAPASILPSLPDVVGEDEFVARFIFESRKLDRAGKAKAQAFMPELYQGNYETSVCRNTGVPQERIRHLANTCRQPPAIAIADVGGRVIRDAQLCARAAPMPNFDEHATILGWPVGDDKSARMMAATMLATEADTRAHP